MGAFLCAISYRDWLVSRKRGVYGNKLGNLKADTWVEFNDAIKNSIIRDLAAMQPSDLVFFHVVKRMQTDSAAPLNSSIHGIYVVRETPYYHKKRIWEDQDESFPYRFLFEPHPDHPQLAKFDAFAAVEDFYELIERREIWSLATLENERNIESRSVRKIGVGEAEQILRILYRDFRYRHQKASVSFSPVSAPAKIKSIETQITKLGASENAIKALIMSKLGKQAPDLLTLIGPISEFMNEVFIAQTTRKAIDVLGFVKKRDGGRRYLICEVKTDLCDAKSLNQLLYYLDLFKRKNSLIDLANDEITGCLIGKRFPSNVIDFCRQLNMQGVNGEIKLIKYKPNPTSTDVTFERII